MAYDGEGNRVALVVNGGTPTSYLGPFAEVSGTTVTKYLGLGLPGLPSALRAGTAALSYLVADGLGSIIGAVESAGAASFQQLYAPYGGTRYSSGTAPATTQSFTGQRADATAGLFYYGARYYDNVVSTFTSADTVRAGLNRDAHGSQPLRRGVTHGPRARGWTHVRRAVLLPLTSFRLLPQISPYERFRPNKAHRKLSTPPRLARGLLPTRASTRLRIVS